MNAEQLMIGDLVFNTEFNEVNRWILGDFQHTNPKNVEPIILSDELLLKNEWEIVASTDNTIAKRCDVTFVLVRKNGCDFWRAEMDGVSFCIIEYVHQLQHALKFCGMAEHTYQDFEAD